MTCENCPNSLLNKFINDKKTAKADLDKLRQELDDCKLKDKFSGKRLFIEDQVIEAQSLYRSYDELAPSIVIRAAERCDGPFERINRMSNGSRYVDRLCGAEVVAKEVCGYGQLESDTEFERLDDDTPA